MEIKLCEQCVRGSDFSVMNQEAPEDSQSPRSLFIAGGCLLACVIGLFLPSMPSTPAEESREPVTHEKLPSASPTTSAPASGENRVTFAQTMPRARGTQVFNNTGKLNLDLVMVALPDGPKSVRFVRGNDPVARRYLARTESRQERTVFDSGPQQIDTSEIANLGPLRGRATRRARNLAAKDAPKAPPSNSQDSSSPQ